MSWLRAQVTCVQKVRDQAERQCGWWPETALTPDPTQLAARLGWSSPSGRFLPPCGPVTQSWRRVPATPVTLSPHLDAPRT